MGGWAICVIADELPGRVCGALDVEDDRFDYDGKGCGHAAKAATEDRKPKNPILVACKVVRLILPTKVKPPRPAALPGQQVVTAER